MKKCLIILIATLSLQLSFSQDAKIFLKQVELEKVYSAKLINFLNKLYDPADYYVYTDVQLQNKTAVELKNEEQERPKKEMVDPFSYSPFEGLGLEGLPTLPGAPTKKSNADNTMQDSDDNYIMTGLRISVYLSENIYNVESREAVTNFVNTNIEAIRNCFDCFVLDKMPSKGNYKTQNSELDSITAVIKSTVSQYEALKDSIKWSVFQQETAALREELNNMKEMDDKEKQLLERQLDEASSAREFWEDQEARRKELDRNLDSLRYVNLMEIEKEYRQKQSQLLENVTSDYELSIQARLDAAKDTEERLFSLIETGGAENDNMEAESFNGGSSIPMFAIILIILFVSVLVGFLLLKFGKKKVVYLKPKDPEPQPQSAYTTPPTTSGENKDVLKSEVRSLRQSAVTMSAGQKEGASQIISDWLDEGIAGDNDDNNSEKEE
tara:strand:- start:98 stop:1414 length:1317 start_codon:yes stop_codon:yes gene_type:complete